MVESRCGILCKSCEYVKTCSCGCCIPTNGHPFYGECQIAICCQNKELEYCGECEDFPCEMLHKYSYDPEHGDTPKGLRIEQCKQWKKEALSK